MKKFTILESLCLVFAGVSFIAALVLAMLVDLGIVSWCSRVGWYGILSCVGVFLGVTGYSIVYLRG